MPLRLPWLPTRERYEQGMPAVKPIAIAPGDPPTTVEVRWSDGRVDRHRARELRLACPCAHCLHELTRAPLLDPASIPDELVCLDCKRIGNYATRFLWSDGHSTGLFTNQQLRQLGESRATDPR